MALANVFVMARQFEEATAAAHAGIELDASYFGAYQCLRLGLAGLGRYDEAVETYRHLLNIAPDFLLGRTDLGWALGLAGQPQEAMTILADLERRRTTSYVGGVMLAWVCLGLGDHDQAISWLHHAAEERDGMMTWLNAWPKFDPLRSDPSFQALLAKMNFPQQA